MVTRARLFDLAGVPREAPRLVRRGRAARTRRVAADAHALYLFNTYATRRAGLPSQLLRVPLVPGGKVDAVALEGVGRVVGYSTATALGMGSSTHGVELFYDYPGASGVLWTRFSSAGKPTATLAVFHQQVAGREPHRAVWHAGALIQAAADLPRDDEWGVRLMRRRLDRKPTYRLVVRGQKHVEQVRFAVLRLDDPTSPIALLWQCKPPKAAAAKAFALRRLDVPSPFR